MAPQRIIIGLMGRAGAGKDTVADHLVREHGFARMAFAEPLKESLYNLNPIIEIASDHRTTIRLQHLVDKYGWDEAKQKPEVRTLLQRMGTEAGRDIHGDDLWLRTADRHPTNLSADRIVVTDVRFPNEATWVLDHDQSLSNPFIASLWSVWREKVSLMRDHITENLDFAPDRVIRNNFDIKSLNHVIDVELTHLIDTHM